MAAAPHHHHHRRTHQLARAPPPTPIATGKGSRSAAVDDRALAEYLEASLKVPDLTLPTDPKIPPEIDFSSLAAGDAAAARRMIAAAAEVGAFRIGGWGAEEVARSTVEAGEGVFGIPETRKMEMEGWFERSDDGVEEFYWRPEAEKVIEEAWPDGYRMFREKMENVASRLENVAELIYQILSENVKMQTQPSSIHKLHSILRLRKYENSHQLRVDLKSTHTNTKSHQYLLSFHICGVDHKFFVRSSVISTTFSLPAGSILVNTGKQLQEWSNGELRSSTGELVLQSNGDPSPSFSLEFMCFLPDISIEPNHSIVKTVSILDQLLIMLALAFLYNLWRCIFSSTNT